MFFKKVYFFVCLFLSLLLYAQPASNDLKSFLSKKAVKVDSLEVINGVNRFLNYKVEKGKPVWFDGSIVTDKGVEYKDLLVNFNVLDNSLYLLHNKTTYRVSNFGLKEFSISQKGKSLKFRKGFAVAFGAKISAKFEGSSQELLSFLSSYSEFENLPLKDISVSENQKTAFKIELRTGFRDQVSGLKKYLGLSERISDLESTYGVSEIGASKYLQVLFEQDNFLVLKYHFKRNASAESVSVIKQTASGFLFADEDYFIADTNNQLHEFLFTKKSLEKVLTTLDISYSQKIKNVGSESRVVDWFESNTFN